MFLYLWSSDYKGGTSAPRVIWQKRKRMTCVDELDMTKKKGKGLFLYLFWYELNHSFQVENFVFHCSRSWPETILLSC